MKHLTASTSGSPVIDDIETQFKTKLINFCAFATRYGYQIEPYSDLTWPKFRLLPGSVQQEVFRKFSEYHDICMMAADSGIPFDDDRSLTWWAMQKFGLRPCSDFFDKLTNDHVLEVYNPDFIQIYRNWAFFEISSYAMGDLFVYPWPDLYTRENTVTENLISHASMALSGSYKYTIPCTSPRHVVSETLSLKQHTLDMQLNYVSPLFDTDGNIAAFFAVSSVNVMKNKRVDNIQDQRKRPTLTLVE